MVFLRFPFRNGINQTSFHHGPSVSSKVIYENVAIFLGITDFKLFYNGKILPPGEETVSQDANVDVIFPLPGGKGGFGSMLRAIGAQIEKTTNREACRDLSGRRLRDINEEQRLKKWISKEFERKAEKARRRKERIERLKAKPRHNFNDFEYEKKLSEWPDRVEEALAAGMEKKRPASEASCSAAQPKKKHLWLDEEMSSSSDSDPEAVQSSPKATTSDSCAESSNEEAGCSSQPQAVFQEGSSTDVKSLKENSSSGEEAGEKSVSNSSETQNKATKEPAEFFELSEGSTSSSNQEKTSKDLSDDGSTNVKDTAMIVSPKEDLSTNQENSNKDPSSNDSNQKKLISESVTYPPRDLMSYNNPLELEALGLDRLKSALVEKGLKCGGPLQDRAQRLWQVRGLEPHQYPPKLLAKKK